MSESGAIAELIRVRGIVQGVGFRPTVYRLATELGLRGEVSNDGDGVVIRVGGDRAQLDQLIHLLEAECPPLARIEAITRTPLPDPLPHISFTIAASIATPVHTQISPDAATCSQCLAEVTDPHSRWFGYPFTNCTHCGPRFSIIRAIPYDRRHTSMAQFLLCADCATEYADVTNRRFHAQPIACPACGPQVWLETSTGERVENWQQWGEGVRDAIAATQHLLQQGAIVAIKGIGGIHLACDATQATVVQRLRQRKHRYHKPFALMARDLTMVRRYCHVSPAEQALLQSSAAPIVLLNPVDQALLPPSLAPGTNTLGFMLPYTPLHHLLMAGLDAPIVLTSGNRSDEPQCIDNAIAREQLGAIADYLLLHNRDIINRIDDSVVRVVPGENNAPQMLRRARGYAPAPLYLPPGFAAAPPILAMGSELKTTFCLLQAGRAVLSQHLGDLKNAAAYQAYEQTLKLYLDLFEHQPQVIAIDRHPDYLSSKLGRELVKAIASSSAKPPFPNQREGSLTPSPASHSPSESQEAGEGRRNQSKLQVIQHHHAHIAACMAEHQIPLNAPPVLGIALDGLGYGADDTLWGGEFLLADYRQFQRLAWFEPIALLGGSQAMYQPWRNTYAQLVTHLGWEILLNQYGDLELVQWLANKPRMLLDQLLRQGIHSPLASSAGRLFDAVAAAVGICREAVSYEGQAAISLDALISASALQQEQDSAYLFALQPMLSAAPLWPCLLRDLQQGIEIERIAARFHIGLAAAIAHLTHHLHQTYPFTHVALTGGVFQNLTLLQLVRQRLVIHGFTVLTHCEIPPNDGGLALGQAAIAAARSLMTD